MEGAPDVRNGSLVATKPWPVNGMRPSEELGQALASRAQVWWESFHLGADGDEMPDASCTFWGSGFPELVSPPPSEQGDAHIRAVWG